MQCNKSWGHDFTRNREENYSYPWDNSVKPNVNERTHKLSTTHFVLCTQSFNCSRIWLSLVNVLGTERYGSQFRIGASHDFWKYVSLLMGQENTQKLVPKPFLTHAFLFLTQLEIAEVFSPRFAAIFLHFPWLGNLFLCCTVDGKRDSWFGVLWRSFISLKGPYTFFEIEFSLPGLIPPSTISFLVPRMFFFIPSTCVHC